MSHSVQPSEGGSRAGASTSSRSAAALAYVRVHGGKVALEAGANFVLPFLIYSLTNERLGAVPALMASSVPPIAWSVIGFLRQRKLDALSILVLAGIALSLLAFAGGGGIKVLQMRENLVGGVIGLVFLGSAAIGRPLIDLLAQARMRRGAPEKAAALQALRQDARFRAALMLATLVWGFGLLAVCALSCALVFMVSIKTYLLISGPISYAAIGLMSAWTFWYVPRVRRQIEGRFVAGGER